MRAEFEKGKGANCTASNNSNAASKVKHQRALGKVESGTRWAELGEQRQRCKK